MNVNKAITCIYDNKCQSQKSFIPIVAPRLIAEHVLIFILLMFPFSLSPSPNSGLITPHRKRRQTYTRHQTAELEREYVTNRYLTRRRRIEISQSLHLSERQIKIWFQNRRMKEKREKDHVTSPRKNK